MSSHDLSILIEVAVALMPFIGVPILCWLDPAHLVEKKRRADHGRGA